MAATVQADLRFMDVVRNDVTKERGNVKVRLNVSGNSRRSKAARIAIARIEGVKRVDTIMKTWLANKLDKLFSASSALELEKGPHLNKPSVLIHNEFNEDKTVEIALNILLENGIKKKQEQLGWKAIREILQTTSNKQIDYTMQSDMKILATHAVIVKKAINAFLQDRLEKQREEMEQYLPEWKKRFCPKEKLSDIIWFNTLEESDFEKEIETSDEKTVVWTLAKQMHMLAFKHREDKNPLNMEEISYLRSCFLKGAEKLDHESKNQLLTIAKYGIPQIFADSGEFMVQAEQNSGSTSYCLVM